MPSGFCPVSAAKIAGLLRLSCSHQLWKWLSPSNWLTTPLVRPNVSTLRTLLASSNGASSWSVRPSAMRQCPFISPPLVTPRSIQHTVSGYHPNTPTGLLSCTHEIRFASFRCTDQATRPSASDAAPEGSKIERQLPAPA